MKPHAPYCDFCGEVIHNYHTVETGEDIIIALQNRQIDKDIKKRSPLFGKIISSIIYIGSALACPIYYSRLCFCNQKHKDLFAEKMGLKRR